ncbi:MAG: hypothetical protein GOVbin3332_29 [Prokaryotic dsDNA virus sp.]|nr:MAG: hypothetical protein GOVbin3332_29 [Prokaryotic dsDNA virus sp.]|tara:strand:+ start:4001 stop:4501 length:501 start_codon:yes stop_codon:yes gene_type:complete
MALTKLNFTGSGQGAVTLPSGSVLQVVSTAPNFTDVSQVGDTSNMDSAISVTITPTSASNKILILGAIEIHLYAVTRVDAYVELHRTIGGSSTTLDYVTIYNLHGSGSYYPYHSDKSPFMHLDSPNTTSAVTYSLTFRQGASSGTVYSCTANGLGASNIVAQEIKG